MNKPVLVVLAAGMGSRYGGMKQIDPVGPNNQLIIDYSIYDAKRAGFERIVFIIKEENHQLFKEVIGDKVAKFMEVQYAFQSLDDIPAGFSVPEGRIKPWGTSHAVYSARHVIDAPFAVINADDYYGVSAFKQMHDYLVTAKSHDYSMVGYFLKNTVTENGSVSRGVCSVDENNYLSKINERTRIEKKEDGIYFTEDDGNTWNFLEDDTIVSMNLLGFTADFMEEISNDFTRFLNENLEKNPLKCEYFLPLNIDWLISDNRASMKVMSSADKWFGVTYKEDKPTVVAAINKMTADGLYPENLWG